MSNAYQHYMERALSLAGEAAAIGEVPVGAVVVKDGEIIAEAFNTRERDQDPTAHAELVAIRLAAQTLGSWRLDGCTVVVTLEPCPMCAGAMVLSRVERCVFGCSDPKGGFLGTVADLSAVPQLNHRFEVVSGVMEAEASGLLKTFFRTLRARPKSS